MIERVTRQQARLEHYEGVRPTTGGETGVAFSTQDPRQTAAEAAAHAPGAAMPEASLQDLLSRQDLDLGFLDPSIFDDEFHTFVWPESGRE